MVDVSKKYSVLMRTTKKPAWDYLNGNIKVVLWRLKWRRETIWFVTSSKCEYPFPYQAFGWSLQAAIDCVLLRTPLRPVL